MKTLHPKQNQILEFLKSTTSNDLIMNDLYNLPGVDSPGVLYYHLDQLEKKGYIKKNPSNSRDYIILDSPEAPVTYVNNYGKAKCGANGTFLDGSPVSRIPITSAFLRFSAAEAFIVEAEGDSMEPKIHPGNLVIAKRNNDPESGDMVVCVYDNKVMIKKFIRLDHRIVLDSLNKKHPLIEVDEHNGFRVEGIVKNVLANF